MTRAESEPETSPAPAWGLRHLWSALGVLLLVMWLPFYAFVSLLGPQWAVFPALVVWALCFFLAVRWFRSYPARTLLVGAGAIVVWHIVGFGLDALGWNA